MVTRVGTIWVRLPSYFSVGSGKRMSYTSSRIQGSLKKEMFKKVSKKVNWMEGESNKTKLTFLRFVSHVKIEIQATKIAMALKYFTVLNKVEPFKSCFRFVR